MIVEVDKISKSYHNEGLVTGREVLNQISLNIKAGDSLSIVGPSGSGKSTLLNILGTLDLPTSGIVKIKGKIIQDFNDNQLAEVRNNNIGFINHLATKSYLMIIFAIIFNLGKLKIT